MKGMKSVKGMRMREILTMEGMEIMEETKEKAFALPSFRASSFFMPFMFFTVT